MEIKEENMEVRRDGKEKRHINRIRNGRKNSVNRINKTGTRGREQRSKIYCSEEKRRKKI